MRWALHGLHAAWESGVVVCDGGSFYEVDEKTHKRCRRIEGFTCG
jgi:hypothetical protein